MYDTLTNTWSIVRASPKNVLEEVQILEDSLAAQIGEDQIYVFAGKNGNKYFFFYLVIKLILASCSSSWKSVKSEKELQESQGSSGT